MVDLQSDAGLTAKSDMQNFQSEVCGQLFVDLLAPCRSEDYLIRGFCQHCVVCMRVENNVLCLCTQFIMIIGKSYRSACRRVISLRFHSLYTKSVRKNFVVDVGI